MYNCFVCIGVSIIYINTCGTGIIKDSCHNSVFRNT